jgi:hypothetical protein
MHTFRQDLPDNYAVGYWAPAKARVYHGDKPEPVANHDGEWMWLRDCKTAAEAASWVSYLNGGKRPDQPW